MAERGQLAVTMKDYLGRRTEKGEIDSIVELLDQTNEIADHMRFREGNGATTHRTTVRTGLPEPTWRLINRGVPQSKSTTQQVEDRIGMLETWSVVDEALANLEGNKPEFMLSEEMAFIEGMNQEVVQTLIYGDLSQNPASFVGLAPRYSTLDKTKAKTAENVIDYGGTGPNLTSIYYVTWGDQTAHMIYPKGTPMGLRRRPSDGGQPTEIKDDNGDEFLGYKTHYGWSLGFVLRDWRSCVRIANIDVDELADMVENGAVDAANQKLIRVMLLAHNTIPEKVKRLGRTYIYMNQTPMNMLDIIAAEKGNVNLTMTQIEGVSVTSFKGTPIRKVEAIENHEKRVI